MWPKISEPNQGLDQPFAALSVALEWGVGLELEVWHEVTLLHYTQYMRPRQVSWAGTLGSVTYWGHGTGVCRRHSTHSPGLFFLLCTPTVGLYL